MTDGEQKLSLLGHLRELRNRLIKVVIALAITTTLSFVFYDWIFNILTRPTQGTNFIFIDITEMVGTIMKVCLASGIILAIPYITFEVIMFIRPALTAKEKKYVYSIMPWVTLMFAGGVVFGYFILVPPAVNFLLQFGSDIATPQLTIGNYINFITRLLLAVGLVFETPVVTTFLAKIGIVSPKWLASKRKAAIIIIFIAAAILTPTIDPVNQTIMAVPLILLYEISIWLAKLVYREKNKETIAESPQLKKTT